MKKMIALLLAAMLLLSLAACASTADPAPAADAAPAETTETTPAAEEAPAAETDAEAPITLTYWLPCNDLEDGAAEQKGTIAAARAFMEKYPNITLDLVPIGGNSDDYNAKFQMGASANNLPDLMNTSYGWVKQWAGTGVIMQLDDIVAEIGGNYKTDALDFADRPFQSISDGQRQRVLLARALCQQPELIVLDEPTSFLDIRYKLELLTILKRMVREEHLAVIMSLHELDLAARVSDTVVCVAGDRIDRVGPPSEIFTPDYIAALYRMEPGKYDPCFDSLEFVPGGAR